MVYESVNGEVDLTKNLILGTGWNGADNDNIFTSQGFTENGALMEAFSCFTTPTSLYYDPKVAAVNLWNQGIGQEAMTTVNAAGIAMNTYSINYIPKEVKDPTCFNEGTKILSLNKNFEEEYIPIENLRKGDLVKSYKHGYRKIDLIGKNIMINNPEKFSECMYKMEKTNENGLLEDLIITGWHSILVDDLKEDKEQNEILFGSPTQMIDDKYLLLCSVSKDFVKLENTDLFTYYHFILENNDNEDERFGVWANGVLSETPSKKEFLKHNFTLL
jgi:hypothetical protein